ncbi:MAG: hypothetical protein HEP71_23715 [Roseivirga sp.]|nr:hypothetical protein [Roseivirga sp.]
MMNSFPRWASAYLRLFCDSDIQQELEGDILSNYHWRCENGKKIAARLHFLRDVLLTARFLFTRNFGPSMMQLAQSSIKMYLRNARGNKRIFLFNLAGLYIGLLCFLAIYSFHQFENSYDNSFTDADRLYRIEKINHDQEEKRTNSTSYLLHQYAGEQIAGIEGITGLINTRYDRINFQYPEGTPWHALKHMVVKSDFFEIFDFDFIEGQASSAFDGPQRTVITYEIKERLFGSGEAIGKIVLLNERPYEITGVIRLPENTHFQFDFLLDDKTFFANPFWDKPRLATDWHYAEFIFHYVKIAAGREEEVIEQLESLHAAKKHEDEPDASFLLQPVSDIHLDESTDWELAENGNGSFVNMIMILGIIIIVLVAVNYSFINIAQVSHRIKELGLRNILGSSKTGLIYLIIIENFLSIFTATVLAYATLFRLDGNLPIDLPIEIYSSMILNGEAILLTLGLVFAIGLTASLSPILYVLNFRPISALQGKISTRFGNSALLKSLMSVQVVISLGLIITMVFFHEQLNYILGKDPGFEVENIGYMERYDRGENRPAYVGFKEALLNIPGVNGVTNSAQLPLRWPAGNNYELVPLGQDEGIMTSRAWIGYDYFKTLEIEMLEGREFSREMVSDTSAIIISESASRELGLQTPLGQKVKIFFRGGDVVEEKRVIGIVKDFNYRTLHSALMPHYYILAPNGPVVTVNFNDINNQRAHEQIRSLWDEFSPVEAFNFTFMNEHYKGQYQSDLAQRNAIYILALVILILASMGIFGISSFISQKATKDLSIRKVLGAEVSTLYLYQAKQYLIVAAISFVLCLAPVYFVITNWLDGYAYRIDITPANFLIGFLMVLTIVVIVVSNNILKVALLNPINTLKDE